MRKYQQLLLVIISLISVCILLMYRSENSKLKYVLEYVNFFGRSDSVDLMVLRSGGGEDNQHVYDDPLPMWTRLGDDFHGYSSFWRKNEFAAGGEVVTIAVGMQRAEVNFRCSLLFPNSTNPITGLFSYTRVELASKETSSSKEHYRVYKFLCKITKDFHAKAPSVVIFHDIHTGSASHFMHINNLSPKRGSTSPAVTPKEDQHEPGADQKLHIRSSLAVCVDFIPYYLGRADPGIEHIDTDKEIFQFFLHHAIVGIQEFIIYGNNFPTHAFDLLHHQQGIRITRLPFNFPYEINDELKIRGILEMDCLLRTSAQTKFVLLSKVNEFFLPPSNVRLNRTFTQSLDVHPNTITRFELQLQTVCEDDKSAGIRIDSHMYDASAQKDHHPFYVYRPRYENVESGKSVEVAGQSSGIVHRYSKRCRNNVNLRDWRQTLTPEHLHFIEEVGKELKMLLV